MNYYEEITKTIDAIHASGNTPMLWSPPGYGKTSLIDHLASRKRTTRGEVVSGSVTVRLGGRTPEDLLGLPMIDEVVMPDGTTTKAVRTTLPDWAQKAIKLAEQGIVYLIFDEATLGVPDVQAVVQDIANERRLAGDVRLPENVYITLSGNRVADVPTAYAFSSAMTSRLTHLQFTPPATDWCNGMRHGFGSEVPPQQDSWRFVIADFIESNPHWLIPPRLMSKEFGWPCPRTWTRLAAQLDTVGDKRPTKRVEIIAEGTVGEAAMQALLADLDGDGNDMPPLPDYTTWQEPPEAFADVEAAVRTYRAELLEHRTSDPKRAAKLALTIDNWLSEVIVEWHEPGMFGVRKIEDLLAMILPMHDRKTRA